MRIWEPVHSMTVLVNKAGIKSPDGKFGKRGNGVARDTLMIFSEELRISILYPVKCVTDTLGSDSFSSLQNYSLIAIPRNYPYLRLWGHTAVYWYGLSGS